MSTGICYHDTTVTAVLIIATAIYLYPKPSSKLGTHISHNYCPNAVTAYTIAVRFGLSNNCIESVRDCLNIMPTGICYNDATATAVFTYRNSHISIPET